MYTCDLEITVDGIYFAFISQELDTTVCFYISVENYDESDVICSVADSLLLELGFTPGKLES